MGLFRPGAARIDEGRDTARVAMLDRGDDLGERQRRLSQARALAGDVDRRPAAHRRNQRELRARDDRIVSPRKFLIDRHATRPDHLPGRGVGVDQRLLERRYGRGRGELDLDLGLADTLANTSKQQNPHAQPTFVYGHDLTRI